MITDQVKKEVISILNGNGSLYDRMNSGQGGQGLPPAFFECIAKLEELGVNESNFDERSKELEVLQCLNIIEILTSS